MNVTSILDFISNNALLFLFIVAFLEYSNIPIFPSTVILPAAGFFIAKGNVSFIFVLLDTISAGVLGSVVMYYVGFYGGNYLLNKLLNNNPKRKEYIIDKIDFIKRKGIIGVFILKFIPVARTIITIPAGVLKLDIVKYTLYSALGIAIYNFVLIYAGYLIAENMVF